MVQAQWSITVQEKIVKMTKKISQCQFRNVSSVPFCQIEQHSYSLLLNNKKTNKKGRKCHNLSGNNAEFKGRNLGDSCYNRGHILYSDWIFSDQSWILLEDGEIVWEITLMTLISRNFINVLLGRDSSHQKLFSNLFHMFITSHGGFQKSHLQGEPQIYTPSEECFQMKTGFLSSFFHKHFFRVFVSVFSPATTAASVSTAWTGFAANAPRDSPDRTAASVSPWEPEGACAGIGWVGGSEVKGRSGGVWADCFRATD